MSTRNPNHRLAKIHRTYTVEETARLFGVHRNTVRTWIRSGLPKIDRMRPTVIAGTDLSTFLQKRRQRNKRPCAAGELFCLRCRLPRKPAGNRAEYRPMTTTTGNLVGTCSACSLQMHRRVSLAKLESIRGDLAVALPKAQEHIGKSLQPSVNCAFNKEP